MKILICGSDGYIGHALNHHLKNAGHEVFGFDNGLRRELVAQVGSDSLFPITSSSDRKLGSGDMVSEEYLSGIIRGFRPDTIVHLAEQPSAPYSMRDTRSCGLTQLNNVAGNLLLLWAMREQAPHAHLIKLGSMGVYGTPNGTIPEQDGPVAYDPCSFYHITKAADSMNVRKSCEWWGLRATDIHQGIVYGHVFGTRLDVDECFGTCVHRFLAQAAIGIPLTVYGNGHQARGFIALRDCLSAIELAIRNPSDGYRVVNQFTEVLWISEIAEMISELTGADIMKIPNPRVESEDHDYAPRTDRLENWGLVEHLMKDELPDLWEVFKTHKSRIKREVIMPTTKWK